MASDPMAEHLAAIKHALERGGTPALIDYINGVASDPLRRVLYIAAQRVLAPRDFQGTYCVRFRRTLSAGAGRRYHRDPR